MDYFKRVLRQGNKKIVIIPKDSPINKGEYVKISSLDNSKDNKEIKKSNKILMENL